MLNSSAFPKKAIVNISLSFHYLQCLIQSFLFTYLQLSSLLVRVGHYINFSHTVQKPTKKRIYENNSDISEDELLWMIKHFNPSLFLCRLQCKHKYYKACRYSEDYITHFFN